MPVSWHNCHILSAQRTFLILWEVIWSSHPFIWVPYHCLWCLPLCSPPGARGPRLLILQHSPGPVPLLLSLCYFLFQAYSGVSSEWTRASRLIAVAGPCKGTRAALSVVLLRIGESAFLVQQTVSFWPMNIYRHKQ